MLVLMLVFLAGIFVGAGLATAIIVVWAWRDGDS